MDRFSWNITVMEIHADLHWMCVFIMLQTALLVSHAKRYRSQLQIIYCDDIKRVVRWCSILASINILKIIMLIFCAELTLNGLTYNKFYPVLERSGKLIFFSPHIESKRHSIIIKRASVFIGNTKMSMNNVNKQFQHQQIEHQREWKRFFSAEIRSLSERFTSLAHVFLCCSGATRKW